MAASDPPVDAQEPLDLFALCNHLAWQAGGPVLIHDESWGVLAYSTLRQALDEGRLEAILRREVPEEHAQLGYKAECEARFASGDDAFELPAWDDIQARRVVAAIRLHGAVVGSVWIAESSGPLDAGALDLARTAAKQASAMMPVLGDSRGRENDAVLSLLLQEGNDQIFLSRYLDLSTRSHARVIAAETSLPSCAVVAAASSAVRKASELSGTGEVHVLCHQRRGRTYLVLLSEEPSTRLLSAARRAAEAVLTADPGSLIAIGVAAEALAGVPRSRADADDVLDYLLAGQGPSIAAWEQVRYGVGLQRVLRGLSHPDLAIEWPLDALDDLERTDRDEALEILSAYFRLGRNAAESARHLCLHPNTFRYRLARVLDTVDIDLEDHAARLLLEIDLARRSLAPPAR